MFKQFILLFILSILAIFFLSHVHQVLEILVASFRSIAEHLSFISSFLPDRPGVVVREVIALIMVPVIIALIINLIYLAIFRKTIPVFMPIIWACWLVLLALLR